MRKLNFYTVKDCFPIPRIEQCLDTLCGNRYFSTLDLLSGYWQIAVHPEDMKKTAFLTKYTVFWSIKWCALACVTSQLRYSVQCSTFWAVFCGRRLSVTWMTLFRWVRILNLHSVIFVNFFYWFREHNLKVKPKKCVLFQEQVEYLGRLVSHKGVTLRSEHVHVIRNWPVPTTKQELQSYLGFANYREYIKKNNALLVQPLHQLVNESKSGPIQLDQCHLDVIKSIWEKLCNAPIFPYPNPDYTFILDCDASETAIGCELLQLDGTEKVIAFCSYSLTPAQRRYCITQKELLAVICFTRQFRHYLLGRPFVVRTDHNSLTWLMSFKNIEGQLARWMEELAQFDMSVVHGAGKLHVNADALSRIPDNFDYYVNYKAGVPLSSLPCFSAENRCKFCTRVEEKWSHFERDVDYVVPLSVKQLQVGPELSQDFSNFWVPGYSVGDLRREQLDDLNLGVILRWLESETSPTQCELALKSPEVRHYWLMRDQLVFFRMGYFSINGKISFVIDCTI